MTEQSRLLLTELEFRKLIERAKKANPAMRNHPERIRQAARLVHEGQVVACVEPPPLPAATESAPAGTPYPFRLTQWYAQGDTWAAVNDRIELDIHGAASMTHIDAPEHFIWDGTDFKGDAQTDLTVSQLSSPLSALRNGITGRGVLVDVPAEVGRNIPDGHVITGTDLESALTRQRLVLQPGDLMFIRFGRTEQRTSNARLGSGAMAGLSIECAEWLMQLQPSLIVTDGGLDVSPSQVANVPVPWHVLVLVGLGIPLVDMADLEMLAQTCQRLERWEFFASVAPLDIPNASGSPVNPLAIF